MAPSHTTEELLAQFLEEQKAQTALLQRIADIQEEHSTKLLAVLVGSGKQLDQLERQVSLLAELVHTSKGQDQRQVKPATEDIPTFDADNVV